MSVKINLIKLFLAALSGASLTLSFAPFNFWIFVYLGLISLIGLYHFSNKSILHAGLLGFSWGIGFFGTHVSWVFVSIYKYGGTSFFLSCIITSIFILYLAVFPALNLILLSKFKLYNISDWRFSFGFAASWALIEIFRGWFLTGFPWGFLGYTQLNTTLKYYASYFGVFSISFLVALIASVLAKILFDKNQNKFKIILLIGTIGLIYLLGMIINLANFNLSNNSNIGKVAIIQGNIAPDDKFLLGSITDLMFRIKSVYGKSTLDLINSKLKNRNIDLILWPETSLPLDLHFPEAKKFLEELNQLGQDHNFGLLLGIPMAVNKLDFYNSVVGLGKARGQYHKINLVPFGDYVPFARWLRGLIKFFDLPLSSFVAGKDQQDPIILDLGDQNLKILATICYDIAYASKLRNRVLHEQPGVIIAASEDGWFGDSLGPHQHLDLVRMRAIETGKYILRATTSGISAVIDNRGNIVKQAPMFKKFTLISDYAYCFKQTFWNMVGNLPVILFLWVCLIIAIKFRGNDNDKVNFFKNY